MDLELLSECEAWANDRGLDQLLNLYKNLEANDFPDESPCSALLLQYVVPIKIVNTVTTILTVLLVFLNIGNFVLTSIRAWEVRSMINQKFGQTGFFLLALSFLMIVGFVSMGFAAVYPWSASPEDEQNCYYLYMWISASYVLVSFCIYNLLYLRSKSVLSNLMFSKSTKIQLFLKWIHYATMTVPLFIIVTTLFFEGILVVPGTCNVDVEPWISGVFLAVDSTLSLSYLFLFLYPVYTTMGLGFSTPGRGILQLSPLGNSDEQSAEINQSYSPNSPRGRVVHTARKNLKLSSLTIFSSMSALIVSTIAPLEMNGPPSLRNLDKQVLLHLLFTFFVIDRLVATYVFFTITTVWRPRFLRGGKVIWYIPQTWLFREDRYSRQGSQQRLGSSMYTGERNQSDSQFNSGAYVNHSDVNNTLEDTIPESMEEEEN